MNILEDTCSVAVKKFSKLNATYPTEICKLKFYLNLLYQTVQQFVAS